MGKQHSRKQLKRRAEAEATRKEEKAFALTLGPHEFRIPLLLWKAKANDTVIPSTVIRLHTLLLIELENDSKLQGTVHTKFSLLFL